MIENIFYVMMGLIMGWAFYKISVFHIEKRSQNFEQILQIKRKSSMWMYIGLSMLVFGLISTNITGSMARCEMMFLFSICLSIGCVDFLIRKIPNELLLSLIVCKVVFLLINRQMEFIVQGLIGLAAGFLIFMIPSLLKIQVGVGDIKYAAVVGFYLGAFGFIKVMLVMALALLIYLLYLLITKKGNLKTAAAMGPYISFGIMFTILFPII